jgi:radical SAM protein with 4Fe4S-binding SPASM domain
VVGAGGLVRRMVDGIRQDVGRMGDHLAALRSPVAPQPGLHSYRIEAHGRRLRVHLRVEAGGAGQLFVNVSDVLHLSRTACEMALLRLERVPERRALAQLRAVYPTASAAQLTDEFRRMATTIARLCAADGPCPTCQIEARHTPLFSTRATAPYKADLALTYACNNACAHCYNEPGRKTMPPLSLDEWQAALDRLYAIGVPHIIFTGGEPTLFAGLETLIAHAEQLGQVTGMNTNGRRLAARGFAAGLQAAGLDHVQITLHSARAATHDSMTGCAAHAETVAGIRSALDAGLHTITNTTLVRGNVAEWEETVAFIHDLGVRTFAVNAMIYAGCGAHYGGDLAEAELAPVVSGIRDRAAELGLHFLWYTPTQYCRLSPVGLGLGPRSCNAAEYSICVEPNGDVLPCQSFYQPAGNLLRDRWEEIWEGELFRTLRMRREEPGPAGLPAKCHECEELPVCGGGCPLQRAKQSSEVTCLEP